MRSEWHSGLHIFGSLGGRWKQSATRTWWWAGCRCARATTRRRWRRWRCTCCTWRAASACGTCRPRRCGCASACTPGPSAPPSSASPCRATASLATPSTPPRAWSPRVSSSLCLKRLLCACFVSCCCLSRGLGLIFLYPYLI